APVGRGGRSTASARQRSPSPFGVRRNNFYRSTASVDPAIPGIVLSALVNRGRGRVCSHSELRHPRGVFPEGNCRTRKRRAEPIPFRGGLCHSMHHRGGRCSVPGPGWALSCNRVSDCIRPRFGSASRGTGLVWVLPCSNTLTDPGLGVSSPSA